MSLHRIVIDCASLSAQAFKDTCNLAPLANQGVINLSNWLRGLAGGNRAATVSCKVGAVQATATIISTGTATDAETMSLLNVTLTAKTSGAVAANGEFNISATPATQAASIAAAITATSGFSGKVTASVNSGTVTVTSAVPGLVGNGLQISEALTNVTVTQFTGGSDGTSYTLDLA